MQLVLIHKILIIAISAFAFVSALIAYLSNRISKVNRYFLLWSFSLILWADLVFIFSFYKHIFETANLGVLVIISRLSWVFLSLFFISFYLFVNHFPTESKRSKIFDFFYSLIWVGIALISLSELVVKNPILLNDIYFLEFNSTQIIIFLVSLFSIFYTYYLIFIKQPYLEHKEKTKTNYFFIISAFFGFLILLFNILLPEINGKFFSFHILGQYSALILVICTAYILIQKNLFALRVVLTQVLVISISIAIIAVPFFVSELWIQILYFIIFFVFVLFAYNLTQSLVKEARKREELENQMIERVRELQVVKKTLEDSKMVLEIKIQARTKALRVLTQNLDQKVKEKTIELENKLKELERANQLMVDRENSMLEMKKELERIKNDQRN